MSGKGTTSSSQSNQQDQRVAATDNGFAVGSNANVSILLQNPDTYKALLDTGSSWFEAALDFAGAENAAAFAAIQAAQQPASSFGLDALKQAGPIILIAGVALAIAGHA
jgi:hypothetical protein